MGNHDAEDQSHVPELPEIESEENLPPVGASYEETFKKQVQNLGTKRQR